MPYPNLVYNLLVNQFWSITPALPVGAPGVRPEVGFPETIPDITFIARELRAADGFPLADRNALNGFNRQARQYHRTFGLAPIDVDSFEDILDHFENLAAPIGRIRIVSHGNDSFLFFPIFTGGMWDYGMDPDFLENLKDSDEGGLRYIISGHPPTDPLLIDGTSRIVDGIRTIDSTLLARFGVQAGGMPAGDALKFFEVVNDLYQVQHGTIVANNDGNPPNNLLSGSQRGTITTSLTRIEQAIRSRLEGTDIGSGEIKKEHLDNFKNAVMTATPIQLEFLGSPINLVATVIADVTAAMSATPRVEANIRRAIRGVVADPLFIDHFGALVSGIQLLEPLKLRLGGADHDEAAIRGNADLLSFVRTCADLHYLKRGPLLINGSAPNPTQKSTLRGAIIAIGNMIRARVTAAPSPITDLELNRLRTKIENLPLRESAITGGWMELWNDTFTELTAANRAMGNNFRAKLDHFRGLLKPADASTVDVRGCLVGRTPAFLDNLRDFMGTAANKPTITAPEWWQSFPSAFSYPAVRSSIYPSIDAKVAGGDVPRDISDVDVNSAITAWRDLIDFDPHFDFIVSLFAPAASKLDFAALDWRVWRIPPAATGLPILRMQAKRIDDLDGLDLGDIIQRFALIFEVPSASTPNAAAQGRLNLLRPHLVTFKTKMAEVAAGPAAGDLPQLEADLTALAGNITGIGGFDPPDPAKPLPPASATLADIQTSVTHIGDHLDTILDKDLNSFFAAIQGITGHANARIRYFYNIGLPLLLQSLTGFPAGVARPTSFDVSMLISAASTAARNGLIADALRSWMRIEWKGTEAQATAMNATIQAFLITTDAHRQRASQVSMVSEEDPIAVPTSDAGICPMEIFNDHIVIRPSP